MAEGDPRPTITVRAMPVAIDVAQPLPAAALGKAKNAELIEIGAAGPGIAAQVACGIAADGTVDPARSRLVATIPPRAEASAARQFDVRPTAAAASGGFRWKPVSAQSLGLWEGERPVLVYNFGTITHDAIPASETRRSRACFVAPLYGLNGEVLTDTFPKDHYHHVGLFWAWPHVQIGEVPYDLWMYRDVRQRFRQWLCQEAGPEAAVLGVENGWYVAADPGPAPAKRADPPAPAAKQKPARPAEAKTAPGASAAKAAPAATKPAPKNAVAKAPWPPLVPAEVSPAVPERLVMIERVWFTVHRAHDAQQAIDVRVVLVPVDRPVTLWGAADKSYGGLNVRYAPPQKDPRIAGGTQITVAAGVAKDDLPETRLTWADLSRKFAAAAAPSGAAIFIDPRHPDYPPTWLTRHYGVLCVGWPGVKPQTLEPGKPVALDNRVWIHQALVDTHGLQAAYDAYVAAAQAK